MKRPSQSISSLCQKDEAILRAEVWLRASESRNASDEEQEYDVAGILVWRCGLEPFISRDTRIMHLLVGKLGG
jgi:hypothetical protein